MATLKEIEGFLREKLSTDGVWAVKAVKTLVKLQTPDEKLAEITTYRNAVGFNAYDAKILTNIAKQLELKGELTGKQMRVLYGALPKYWRQILNLL